MPRRLCPNQGGGEKRLNVAFSRAKHHMCVVSSIRQGEITNDYNEGANCLKTYLRYAEAASAGDAGARQRVLRDVAARRDAAHAAEASRDAVVEQLGAALAARGYAVEARVGMSHFRCDLAVRRHGEERHRLGILVDTDEHYRQDDVLERDLMRPQLLGAFGWQVARVLAADWHRRRAGVLEELVRQLEEGERPEESPGDDVEDPWAELEAALPPPVVPAGQVTPAAVEPVAEPAAPATRYLEFVGGGSRKFWEVSLDGSTLTVRFGRIGTAGQTQQKRFADAARAAAAAQRLVREKLAKGYEDRPRAAP